MTAAPPAAAGPRTRRRKPPTRYARLVARVGAMPLRQVLVRMAVTGVVVGFLALVCHVPAAAVSSVFALGVTAWPLAWWAADDSDRMMLYPLALTGMLAGYYLPAGVGLATGLLASLPG